jgi:hypothetical protein
MFAVVAESRCSEGDPTWLLEGERGFQIPRR